MNELVHQADLAVYRAKLQGRNRVLDASDEPLLAQPDKRTPRARLSAAADPGAVRPTPAGAPRLIPEVERRQSARPHTPPAPRFFSVPRRLGAARRARRRPRHRRRASSARSSATRPTSSACITIVGLVGIGQALSLEVEETGSISVSAVGALAAAAIIGPRAALPLALTMSAVEWSARRAVFHQLLFNVGALSLASLAAAAIFSFHIGGRIGTGIFVASGPRSQASPTSSSTRASSRPRSGSRGARAHDGSGRSASPG